MKGKQIVTLDVLIWAAKNKSAIVVPGTTFNDPHPAAFIINLQGRVIYSLFKQGMFIYIKENKPKKPKPMTWQASKKEAAGAL